MIQLLKIVLAVSLKPIKMEVYVKHPVVEVIMLMMMLMNAQFANLNAQHVLLLLNVQLVRIMELLISF